MQGHHSGAGRDLVLSSSIHKEFAQRDRMLYGHCASTTRIFRFAPFVGGFLILPAMRVVDDSDIFTPSGRTKVQVIWDLSVKRIDDKTCEFINTVHSSATPELLDFLGKQGIPFEVFRTARKPLSEAHNRQETPLFARSIERHALRRK